MKRRNRLLRSIIFLLLNLSIGGSALNACISYVDLLAYDIESLIGSDIEYYHEYDSQKFGDDKESMIVSFPIKSCYKPKIETVGNVRWFFTSAIGGGVSYAGRSIQILDDAITNVLVVRGRASNNCWVQVYFGYNSAEISAWADDPIRLIYEGKILCLQWKDSSHIERQGVYLKKGAKYLDSNAIRQAISNQDWRVQGPQQDIRNHLFCRKEGSHFSKGSLVSTKCYWP